MIRLKREVFGYFFIDRKGTRNLYLVSHDGHVMDGQRRVMRAFIEGKKEIKIKPLPKEIPEDTEMPQ